MYEEGDMAYTHMKSYCDAVSSPSGDWNVNWTLEEVKRRYDQIPWKNHTTYPNNLKWQNVDYFFPQLFQVFIFYSFFLTCFYRNMYFY